MKHRLLLPAYKKCSHKIWGTKNVRRPSIAKRTTKKKVMYSILFNSRGETIQVPIPHSKTVTLKLYRRLAMKKFENYVKKSHTRLCISKPYPFRGQCASTHLKRNTRVLGEERLDNPPAPTLSTRFSLMLLFLASTSEKESRGSEISLKTGCWSSSVSVS